MIKKLQYFIISREMFSELFKNGIKFEVCDGLPEDSEVINVIYKEESDTYIILVYSNEFKELEEAEIIPEFKTLSFKRGM